jgi:hypothetical protein
MANEYIRDPARSAIAISYAPQNHIADKVLPRKPIGQQAFTYYTFDLGEGFRVPDTLVGPRGEPAELEMHGVSTPAKTSDQALKSRIPQRIIDEAPPGIDPIDSHTKHITEALSRRREQRVSALVFAAGTYPSGNKVQLSGTGQWSDKTNSDPIFALLGYLDAMIIRANTLVLGMAVATALTTHPKVLSGYFRNGASGGVVPMAYLQEALRIENIYVGETRVNTAKPGQTPTIAGAWGKHAALLYLDPNAQVEMEVATFGMTAESTPRTVLTRQDPTIGAFGGTEVRVVEAISELVCASNLGYFVQDAVA